MSKEYIKRLAATRIKILFNFALKQIGKNIEIAKEAISIARKISSKARVRIPRKYRILYCHKCGTPFLSSKLFRFRIKSRRQPHIVLFCKECKTYRRIIIKK